MKRQDSGEIKGELEKLRIIFKEIVESKKLPQSAVRLSQLNFAFHQAKAVCGDEIKKAGLDEILKKDEPWTLQTLEMATTRLEKALNGGDVTPGSPGVHSRVFVREESEESGKVPTPLPRRDLLNLKKGDSGDKSESHQSKLETSPRRAPGFENLKEIWNKQTTPTDEPPPFPTKTSFANKLAEIQKKYREENAQRISPPTAASRTLPTLNVAPRIKSDDMSLTSDIFFKIQKLRPIPSVKEDLKAWLPHILQKIKMWGVHSIEPNKDSTFSRMDLLRYLFTNLEYDVLADICIIFAKFHVPLPLLLKQDSGKSLFLAPLLKNCIVRWKASDDGKTLTNYLFTDPFTLIVAARIGNPLPKDLCSGKTTILNKLCRSNGERQSFTTNWEGNSDTGKASSKPYLEFTWLTEAVCSKPLWDKIKEGKYYEQYPGNPAENRLILLANFHGDILQHKEMIQTMQHYVSGFLIFMMADAHTSFQTKKQEFMNIFEVGKMPLPAVEWCFTDPDQNNGKVPSGVHKITTFDTFMDNNMSKLVVPLVGLIHAVRDRATPGIKIPSGNLPENARIQWAISEDQQLAIQPVDELLQCLYSTTNVGSLIGTTKSMFDSLENWKNPIYKKIMIGFIGILLRDNLQTKKYALNSLELELGRLSKLKPYEEARNSLEIKHFLREVGYLYEASSAFRHEDGHPEFIPFQSLPQCFAELVLNGTTLELLDGGISEMSLTWLNSVFHEICHHAQEQNLRVFVLSILGLQSSGKSTLLNALFGCKFPESVGPCTSGLFLRIFHLDQKFKQLLNLDLIVLIDTEGLGSPEKSADNFREQDRLLATFTMCISDLTLINFLGESKGEIQEILEIVIVTLARLNEVNISPNIHLVQHQATKDRDAVENGFRNFCAMLSHTIDTVGRNREKFVIHNLTNLELIQKNLTSGETFQVFGNFKSGGNDFSAPSIGYHKDIELLYNRILDIMTQKGISSGYRSFHFWHEHLNDFWNAIKSDHFVRRFRNIKEISEFLERNHQCLLLKELIDAAFRNHRKQLERLVKNNTFQINHLPNTEEERKVQEEKTKKDIDEILNGVPESCEFANLSHVICDDCKKVVAKIKQLFREPGANKHIFDDHLETSVQNYITQTRARLSKQLQANFLSQIITHVEGNSDAITSTFNPFIKQVLEEFEVAGKRGSTDMGTHIDSLVDRILELTHSTMTEMYKTKTVVERLKDAIRVAYVNSTALDKLLDQVVELTPEASRSNSDWLFPAKQILLEKEAFEKPRGLGKAFLNFVVGKKNFKRLQPVQVDYFEEKFKSLPLVIRSELKNSDRFEDGMVSIHKFKVEGILEEFMKKTNGELYRQFIHELNAFAIRFFSNDMQRLEAEWSLINQPFRILEVRKEHFRKQIRLHLLPANSIERRSVFIASELINGIKSYIKAELDKLIESKVKAQKWILSIDSVRQRYFTALAKALGNGNSKPALYHFRDPRNSITEWFFQELDKSVDCDAEIEKHHEFFTELISSFLDNLASSTSSAEDFRLATAYFLMDEILEECVQDLKGPSDVVLLVEIITNRISETQVSIFEEIKKKLYRPSENKHLQNLLGCTSHCPCCGSLCWGYKGHETSGGMMNSLHHTCHQPRGLFGCINLKTLELVATSCGHKSAQSDRENVGDYGSDLWLYAPHPKKQLEGVMKWFFVKLQKELADEYGAKVVSEKFLRKSGYNDVLDLKSVHSLLRSLN